MDWQKKTNSETRPGWLCIGSPAFRDACVRDARPSAQKSAWRLDPSIHHDARHDARRERHDSVGESRWLPVGRAERWRHPQVSKVRWCQRSQRRGKKKEFFALGQDRGVGSEIPTKSSNGRRENLKDLGRRSKLCGHARPNGQFPRPSPASAAPTDDRPMRK
jgi:hypothetical protein